LDSHDIVVIGASAGGVEALRDIARDLPAGLPAAVIVVLHVAPTGTSALAGILHRAGPLPAVAVVDGDPIEPGRIYVAPPDCHVLVEDGRLRLDGGPRQNGHRPAVDPLFRSAADVYGPRVVGVILSGSLDDGSLGLSHVKARGGVAIIQDPEDAFASGMPASALRAVAADQVVPAAEVAALLVEFAHGREVASRTAAPEPDERERDEREPAWLSENSSGYRCPECGGSLWERQHGEIVQFKCRVGHVYSLETMLSEQAKALEAAMWSALQALQERESMLRRLAARVGERGHNRSARSFERQANEAAERATLIRETITRRPAGPVPGELEHEASREAKAS